MKENEKKRRRKILQTLKAEEQAQFRALLPAPESELKALFDYLDENLAACEDSLQQTIRCIRERSLPEQEIIFWLNENGAFCDCEVLANAEDNWNQMLGE